MKLKTAVEAIKIAKKIRSAGIYAATVKIPNEKQAETKTKE